MKKVLVAALILIISNSENLFAQCGDIVLTNVSLQDTGYMQSTVLLNFSLTNISQDTVTVDSLKVKGFVIGHGAIADQVNTASITFLPGQSFPFSNQLDLIPVAFQTGDNVVVIWPIINQSDCDSAIEIIYVKDNVGINDPELNSKLFIGSLYNNQFQIHNLTQTPIFQSTVFDLNGKLLTRFSGEKSQIQLNNISSGIYLLEIILADGRKGIFKVLVQ